METDTEIPDIMTVTNLEVISGTKFTDFTIPATGLTLIHTIKHDPRRAHAAPPWPHHDHRP